MVNVVQAVKLKLAVRLTKSIENIIQIPEILI